MKAIEVIGSVPQGALKPKRIVRLPGILDRLGFGRSKFYKDYVATGRAELVHIGPRIVAMTEEKLERLIDEVVAESAEAATAKPSLTTTTTKVAATAKPNRKTTTTKPKKTRQK